MWVESPENKVHFERDQLVDPSVRDEEIQLMLLRANHEIPKCFQYVVKEYLPLDQ